MRAVSADEIDGVLDFPGLIDQLQTAFAGRGYAPPRHHHAVGGSDAAVQLIMPAWTDGAPGAGSFLGTKIVNVFRGNRQNGLPAVLGSYFLQSGATGEPLAVMDGTRLTHWRTAAASALAARYLARHGSLHLLMVGAGALAPFLIRAHSAARSITEVTIWNHRPEGAEALAASLRTAGVDAKAHADLESAVRRADIVSCATLATTPLLRGSWLQPGQHIDLVGAFTLGMREVDDTALRRARVFVDTEDALHEGGDVAIGLRDGVITPDSVQATLHELCRGEKTGRRDPSEITLFKSTGSAIEDLAAAMLVWERLAASPVQPAL